MAKSTTATLPESDRASPKEWAGLALLALPMLALATDLTVLLFALPTLSADLEPSATQTLWITHVYGFLLAGFLLTSGRLGDRIGPRRLMLTGSAVFAALSVAAAFSPNAETLIAVRAALGIAGASLMPSLFALLRTMFRDETQRRLAIAILFSTFTVGGAVGPVLGGALLEYFWWGAVFLVNVPPLVLLIAGGVKLLPERAERNRSRIDLLSVALSVIGILAIVYGLQELSASRQTGNGTIWPYVLSAVGGAGFMGLFVRRQRRIDEPLFDLSVLGSRRMAVSLATLVLVGISVTGVFYLFTQYLQWVGGLSPLRAGLWTLPFIAFNIIGAMLAPGLARRLRPAVVVTGGIVISAVGAGLFSLATGSAAGLPLLVAAISIVGFGQGCAVSLVSDMIISSVPEEQTGAAASAQEVGGELGTALGIAAGGAVGVVAYRYSLNADMPEGLSASAGEEAKASVHEGVEVAEGMGAGGPGLLDAIREAVGFGQQVYAGIGGVVLALSAAVAFVFLVRRPDRSG